MKVAEARVSPGHRTQEIVAPMRPQRTLRERFWSKVDKSGDCWLWTATRSKGGYGHFYVSSGKMVPAHRWAYEQEYGPIPEGLQIDHLCRTPSCVRAGHLDVVTTRENTRRGIGPSAINARKTHCPKGHEYTPDNTRVYRRKRHCRQCNVLRERQIRRLGMDTHTRRRRERGVHDSAGQALGLAPLLGG